MRWKKREHNDLNKLLCGVNDIFVKIHCKIAFLTVIFTIAYVFKIQWFSNYTHSWMRCALLGWALASLTTVVWPSSMCEISFCIRKKNAIVLQISGRMKMFTYSQLKWWVLVTLMALSGSECECVCVLRSFSFFSTSHWGDRNKLVFFFSQRTVISYWEV